MAANTTTSTIAILHLFFFQNASFFILLAYIFHHLHFSLFRRQCCPTSLSSSRSTPPSPPFAAPSRCSLSSSLAGSLTLSLRFISDLGSDCCWSSSISIYMYNLRSVCVWKGCTHVISPGMNQILPIFKTQEGAAVGHSIFNTPYLQFYSQHRSF